MSASTPDGEQPGFPPLDKLLTLGDAAEICGLSPSHLRLLVRTEQIWGIKLGKNWFTTEEAVLQYIAEEHKRGPSPQTPPQA